MLKLDINMLLMECVQAYVLEMNFDNWNLKL